MRILISRKHGGWGDQLCCEVAVRACREKYPQAEIIWATSELYFPLFYDQKHAASDVIAPGDSRLESWDEHILEIGGPLVEVARMQAVGHDLDIGQSELKRVITENVDDSGIELHLLPVEHVLPGG